jgi:hypothetical protein
MASHSLDRAQARVCAHPLLTMHSQPTAASGSTWVMEKSRKVVEHIRDGREGPAWEAAQALAKAVLGTRQVMLAAAVLKGGPS